MEHGPSFCSQAVKMLGPNMAPAYPLVNAFPVENLMNCFGESWTPWDLPRGNFLHLDSAFSFASVKILSISSSSCCWALVK